MAENPETGPEPTAADTPGPDPWANTDSWLRLLLTVVYFIIFWLSLWLLGLAVVINLGVLIFTGRRNEAITGFARQLAAYQRQMALFASQASSLRPFPFGEPLPASQEPGGNPDPVTAEVSAEADTSSPGNVTTDAKKKRTRKTPARKKRRKKTAGKVTQAQPGPSAAEPPAGESAGEKSAAREAPALQPDADAADSSDKAGDDRK